MKPAPVGKPDQSGKNFLINPKYFFQDTNCLLHFITL